MTRIRIRIGEPSVEGRLHARYDEEAGVLEVGSCIQRRWESGMDVDGNLIFDVDSNRVLANVDLLVARRLWTPVTDLEWPEPTKAGDLIIEQESLEIKSFSLPLSVRCNQDRTDVRIELGKPLTTRAISLSTDVAALVDGVHLVGFHIRGLNR